MTKINDEGTLNKMRMALGVLLAEITLGECLICGHVPTDHKDDCPVPKALEVFDAHA